MDAEMMIKTSDLRFFALAGSAELGAAVAGCGGIALAPHEERFFEDGEHKARPLVSVRGSDVYVLLSLAGGKDGSVNDKLCRLLFFIAACRDNGAKRVTAIVPYLAYSRKDRQTKARDPVTTRYVAQLFEAVGIDCIVTIDVHNLSAYQNAFRVRTVHLDTRRLFLPTIRDMAADLPICVVSPDGGGVKRAQLLKEMVETELDRSIGFAFVEKRRSQGVVSGDMFAGEVEGAAVFIVDDMISTGTTMKRAAQACRDRGARKVFLLAAHGLFHSGEAFFEGPDLDGVFVTDTVPGAAQFATAHPASCLRVLTTAHLLADTIDCLHNGGSITGLLGFEA